MIEFSRVISVRERKVGAAKSSEAAAFLACEAARQKLSAARQRMEGFAEEVKDLEIRLLSDLMKTNITVHDVARLRDKLRDVEIHTLNLVDQVRSAQSELAAQEQRLEAKRQATLRIQSKLRRITELDKKLEEIEAKDRLKKEDEKMDEFIETMTSRGPF